MRRTTYPSEKKRRAKRVVAPVSMPPPLARTIPPFKLRMQALLDTARRRPTGPAQRFIITSGFLTRLWDRQSGRCALSGLQLELPEGHPKTDEEFEGRWAHLDVMHPKAGYVPGNVRFVCRALGEGRRVMAAKSARAVSTNSLSHQILPGTHRGPNLSRGEIPFDVLDERPVFGAFTYAIVQHLLRPAGLLATYPFVVACPATRRRYRGVVVQGLGAGFTWIRIDCCYWSVLGERLEQKAVLTVGFEGDTMVLEGAEYQWKRRLALADPTVDLGLEVETATLEFFRLWCGSNLLQI